MRAIGEGGLSSVWKVRSLQFNRVFAAKVMVVRQNVESAWKAFDCEVQALLRLHHPNIISLYAHFRYCENFIMILEYLPKGSLAKWMKKNGAVEGNTLIQAVKDLCSALTYARSKGVLHRDVRPAKIMLGENGRIKLMDFGISLIKSDRKLEVVDFKCSVACAAPEIIEGRPYDPIKSDIWATGITILWMARGEKPWQVEGTADVIRMIRHGFYVIPNDMDPMIRDMAKKMLAMRPEEREFPTVEELGLLGGGTPMMKSKSKRSPEMAALHSVGQLRVGRMLKPAPALPAQRRSSNIDSLTLQASAIQVLMSFQDSGTSRYLKDNRRGSGVQSKILRPLPSLMDEVPQLAEILSHV